MSIVSKIPKPGDVGLHVGLMQEALNRNGAKLKVDNDFGPSTKKAVSEFQIKHGLSGSGVPGEKTMAMLGFQISGTSGNTANGNISTGSDPDEGTPPWYRRMFTNMLVDAGYQGQVNNAVAVVKKGYNRYYSVAKSLGLVDAQAILFAWILGTIHFKEASGNFAGVLHNGEHIIGTGKKTTLVPKGRGPFTSWEQAAIDAILLNGSRWAKLMAGSTDIGDILYAMERFNGTGYISGAGKLETSPYLWANSNVNDDFGKYVSDGKFDANATTQKTVGAAVILKELYKEGLFKCTGVVAVPPVKVPDTTPQPGKYSRQQIADKIISLIQKDVDAELRETHGKNRSPRIDSFNKRAKSYLGAPYCASGIWTAIDDTCIAFGLKNPVPPTASSQAFRKTSFVPAKYIRPEGSLGKKGDVGVLQSPGDSSKGHLVALSKDQVSQPLFETVEYNTDAISGDRDGDGAYAMERTTVDKSSRNAGKIFVCFTDVAQWIYDANNKT